MAKIRVEHHDNVYEVTFDDGATFEEVADLFAKMGIMMGYARKTVDEYIVNYETEY